MRFCRLVEIFKGGGSTRQPQRIRPCQCVSGRCWACRGTLQGQMQTLLYTAGVVGPTLGAGVAVMVFFNVKISRRGGGTRQPQSTESCQRVSGQPWTCHGALLGQMQSFPVLRRCGEACTGGCGRAGQVVYGGCGFAGFLWGYPKEEAVLSNQSTQSTASV